MTKFANLNEDSGLEMTGEEEFPFVGSFSSEHVVTLPVSAMIAFCKGLNPFWDCLEKACIVRDTLRAGVVVLGSMLAYNDRMDATYGYEYNLPFEFHAWWQPRPGIGAPIVDIALPGVISKGASMCDSKGVVLTGREPAIMVGKPPVWLSYVPRAIYHYEEKEIVDN